MNCQDTTKIQIVMWMLGSPGLDRWRLLARLLTHYPVEYAGFNAEGGWVADPTLDRDDLTTCWKLALIDTLAHFERPEIRQKFFDGMPVRYGFFLTKAVWSLTQQLEGAGAIPMRERKKCPRDENGKRMKPNHKPARHARGNVVSFSKYLDSSIKYDVRKRDYDKTRDIAAIPDSGEHYGY